MGSRLLTLILAELNNPSRANFCDASFYTYHQTFPDPERPHAQGMDVHLQSLRQPLAIVDLGALFTLIVQENQLTIVCRKVVETAPQAIYPEFRVFRRGRGGYWVFGLLGGNPALFFLLLVDFQKQKARHADNIGCGILDFVALGDPLGGPGNGLIGVVQRRWRAAPLEKTFQVFVNLEILCAG